MIKSNPLFIRSASLTGYRDLATQLGLDTNSMLRRVRIDAKSLHDPDKLILSQSFVRLLELSADAAKCPDFGLRLSRGRGMNALEPIGLLALNEPDVERAVFTMAKYLHIHNEGLRLETQIKDEVTRFIVTPEFGSPHSSKQVIELSLGVAVDFLRMLLGRDWNPIAVYFVHSAPADTSSHRRIFRAPLHFDQESNGLALYTNKLKVPIRNANELMHKYLLRYINSLATRHGDDIVSKTRHIIRDLLGSGRCGKTVVAGLQAMDPSTLQRKLQAQGYTFKSLLDEIRVSVATEHLSNSMKPLTEIAEILGYSELSAFSRFFQRMFGASPSKWRRENSEAEG
jgi:AraC-like DNA-binding protein